MKIAFISKKTDINNGSYRIWVNDLNYYFNSLGIKSSINPKSIDEYDIHIYEKGNFKIKNKKKINGSINPTSDSNDLKLFDFIIVGSVEERESMIDKHQNIFIFPLIEKMYLNLKPKKHLPQKEITIGYHGNPYHLNHFNLGLKNALERLNKKFKLKFLYVTKNDKEWVQGIPKIKKEFINWDIKTIKNTIYRFDIGIVPTVSEIYNDKKLNTNMTLGLYNTDMKIRFKNKANNGRILVLAQCGIPIVADLIPSNMHILGNPDNGFAVLGEEGWYQALKKLCKDHELRNSVSVNAYQEVKRIYDPLVWAKKLYKKISKINKKIK